MMLTFHDTKRIIPYDRYITVVFHDSQPVAFYGKQSKNSLWHLCRFGYGSSVYDEDSLNQVLLDEDKFRLWDSEFKGISLFPEELPPREDCLTCSILRLSPYVAVVRQFGQTKGVVFYSKGLNMLPKGWYYQALSEGTTPPYGERFDDFLALKGALRRGKIPLSFNPWEPTNTYLLSDPFIDRLHSLDLRWHKALDSVITCANSDETPLEVYARYFCVHHDRSYWLDDVTHPDYLLLLGRVVGLDPVHVEPLYLATYAEHCGRESALWRRRLHSLVKGNRG